MRTNPNMKRTAVAVALGAILLGAGCDRRDTAAPVTPAATPAPATTAAPTPTPANPSATTPTPATAVGPGDVIKVADITGNWTNYAGKTVTVVADVQEVKGPRAFTLDEDSPLKGGIDNDLLVLSPKAGSLANIDDQWRNNKVRVTGVVHKFVTIDIEREIGWDLDKQIEVEWEGKRPVLIATSVERVK